MNRKCTSVSDKFNIVFQINKIFKNKMYGAILRFLFLWKWFSSIHVIMRLNYFISNFLPYDNAQIVEIVFNCKIIEKIRFPVVVISTTWFTFFLPRSLFFKSMRSRWSTSLFLRLLLRNSGWATGVFEESNKYGIRFRYFSD